MNRRHFLSSAGVTLGAAAISAEPAVQPSGIPLVQEPLGYDFGALEPHIDSATLEIHYKKHHAVYVDDLRSALHSMHVDAASASSLLRTVDYLTPRGEPTALQLGQSIETSSDQVRAAIRRLAGGHMNHTLFWRYMAPVGSVPAEPQGKLAAAIQATFGGLGEFKKVFTNRALKHFGSGWAWLVYGTDRGLFISTTANDDNPLMKGVVPDAEYGRAILCVDLWEHAYYLKHRDRRADYLAAWWNVVNWPRVEKSYGIVTTTPG